MYPRQGRARVLKSVLVALLYGPVPLQVQLLAASLHHRALAVQVVLFFLDSLRLARAVTFLDLVHHFIAQQGVCHTVNVDR